MPRIYASYFAMSKAIGLNERIGKYCFQKKVEFYDLWNDFVGQWQYFKKDGIHLNEAGHKKFDDILGQEYERIKNRLHPPHPPEPYKEPPKPITSDRPQAPKPSVTNVQATLNVNASEEQGN